MRGIYIRPIAIACLFFFFTLIAKNSLAQAGALDTTFGNGGIVETSIDDTVSESAIIRSMILQNDGKILAGGYSRIGEKYGFTISRYNNYGSIDSTFGANGIVTTRIDSDNCYGYSLALQKDGKIIIAGTCKNIATSGGFALARYNADGSLDTTFADKGIIKPLIFTPLAGNEARSVVLDTSGNILVSGYHFEPNFGDFANALYDSTGKLNAFSNTTLSNRFGYSAKAYSTVLQNDGTAIAAGSYGFYNGIEYFALARFYPVGSNFALDFTFGNNGLVRSPTFVISEIYSMAIQSDGKIITAGYILADSVIGSDFALARYNSNGSVDTTFGIKGFVETQIGTRDAIAYSVALQPDGRIVAGGMCVNANNDSDFVVVRYNTEGNIDSTFGNDGMVITDIGNSNDVAYSVKLQDDGKILVAGYSADSGGKTKFVLVRYNGDNTINSIVNDNIKPSSFNLGQNYPNPFNPLTTIKYSIPQAAFVSLKVYDVLGREITTLVDGYKQVGKYEIEFNAADLSSGVYFYRLKEGNHTAVKKMLLLK